MSGRCELRAGLPEREKQPGRGVYVSPFTMRAGKGDQD